MNIFKAELDTIHQNGVIGPITQFDNATLELQILSGGQVGESWNSPEFELIAMKRDMNPVREVDQDKFTILSNEDHRVRIDLKEQFLTCRGTVKMQLVIKDGSRISTTVFRLSVGQSLDHDIIASIRDVEVFEQLDLYVAQGFSTINEAIEITGELKKEMTEINNEASECEKERQAGELTRNQRELVRVDNEEDRVVNELGRIQNEEIRVTNEEERVSSENTRITNENNRRIHENTRISQEVARQEAECQRNAIFEENENIRSEQENTRIKSENERKKKFTAWEERETIRLKSEENRILQERERVENEENRKRQELTRQNQEEYRQRTYTQFNEAEASRVNNEIQREASEKQRQQAEKNRDANYQTRENKRDTEYSKAEEVRNNAFEQNEANRQNEYTVAERERVESEELRKGRERDRANAETKRQEAETARADAETGRVEKFNKEIEKAKTTMATATSNVNTAISQADATMQGIEKRAEDCLPAIEKSASAKVDYMGNEHDSIKDAMDANVEFVLDEVNTVHYEGQRITATDTIGRQVKSAILSGNTLVNIKPKTNLSKWGMSSYDSDSGICTISGTNSGIRFDASLLKTSTKYLVMFEIIELPSFAVESDDPIKLTLGHNSYNYLNINRSELKVGTLRKIVTTANEFTEVLAIGNRGEFSTPIKLRFVILEYQDGMENWDIPYFEGMKSVQMPVLSTCGKNLFNINDNFELGYISERGEVSLSERSSDFKRLNNGFSVKVNSAYGGVVSPYMVSAPNTPYKIDFDKVGDFATTANIIFFDNNKKAIGHILDDRLYNSFTTPPLCKYIRIGFWLYATPNTIIYENIQLEEGTQVTPYEPFKTNILTVDGEYRGIGDVCDTVDLVTGEVTERVVEIVLDGSESWRTYEAKGEYSVGKFTLPLKALIGGGAVPSTNIKCDKINVGISAQEGTQEQVSIYYHKFNGDYCEVRLCVPTSKLISANIEGIKTYVQNNPFTLQYQSAESIIKTVDLKGQKVYSYDGTTHYTCSAAEGSLVPTLSIDVPTNLPALVSRQRATIETQKEQIQTLENENTQLIAQNEVQDTDIALNQDAINFMLFAPSVKSISEDKGVSTMAAYLANQILKGRLDYTLVISRYGEFKEDIDTILIAEGKQDLITKGD